MCRKRDPSVQFEWKKNNERTHLYDNTQNLIKWLERSDETANNVSNVFYEYDTDNSKDCK